MGGSGLLKKIQQMNVNGCIRTFAKNTADERKWVDQDFCKNYSR